MDNPISVCSLNCMENLTAIYGKNSKHLSSIYVGLTELFDVSTLLPPGNALLKDFNVTQTQNK